MTHVFHGKLPGYDPEHVLVDGCPECEERAKYPMEGLSRIDSEHYQKLYGAMLDIKWSGGDGARHPVSNCDLRLIHALYQIAVLRERMHGENPRDILR